MRTLKNLWDFKYKYHVVTAREVLGLLHFGYTMKPGPASLWFVCTDPAQAKTATVQEYGSFMQSHEAAGPDSIRSILVMDPKLKKEIEGFDKAKAAALGQSDVDLATGDAVRRWFRSHGGRRSIVA